MSSSISRCSLLFEQAGVFRATAGECQRTLARLFQQGTAVNHPEVVAQTRLLEEATGHLYRKLIHIGYPEDAEVEVFVQAIVLIRGGLERMTDFTNALVWAVAGLETAAEMVPIQDFNEIDRSTEAQLLQIILGGLHWLNVGILPRRMASAETDKRAVTLPVLRHQMAYLEYAFARLVIG